MVLGHSGCRRRWDKVRGGPEEVAKLVATPRHASSPSWAGSVSILLQPRGDCGEGVGTCPREGSERAFPCPSLPAAAVPLCHHLPPLCLHQPLLWQRGFPGQQLSHL